MRRAPRGSLGLQGRHLLLNVLEVIKKKDDKLKDPKTHQQAQERVRLLRKEV